MIRGKTLDLTKTVEKHLPDLLEKGKISRHLARCLGDWLLFFSVQFSRAIKWPETFQLHLARTISQDEHKQNSGTSNRIRSVRKANKMVKNYIQNAQKYGYEDWSNRFYSSALNYSRAISM